MIGDVEDGHCKVRLARTVRSNNAGDSRFEMKCGCRCKGFKSFERKRLQIHAPNLSFQATIGIKATRIKLNLRVYSLRLWSISNAARAADCSASRLLFPEPSAITSPATRADAVKLLS